MREAHTPHTLNVLVGGRGLGPRPHKGRRRERGSRSQLALHHLEPHEAHDHNWHFTTWSPTRPTITTGTSPLARDALPGANVGVAPVKPQEVIRFGGHARARPVLRACAPAQAQLHGARDERHGLLVDVLGLVDLEVPHPHHAVLAPGHDAGVVERDAESAHAGADGAHHVQGVGAHGRELAVVAARDHPTEPPVQLEAVDDI
eukprot:CAMPEP_0182859936 /NCGR_PEP_ID=MMETSP0034_2-20130328/4611_1 /TAXON_ID=156128 /ORGANISM="Nephroselmis pyriformis, Strain CCMP717" /LENGTH=202 /DNA_ID=CAMNT_0024991647 /DNA_START=38 /DNA_END=646 /DNA_ORIENTATION=-